MSPTSDLTAEAPPACRRVSKAGVSGRTAVISSTTKCLASLRETSPHTTQFSCILPATNLPGQEHHALRLSPQRVAWNALRARTSANAFANVLRNNILRAPTQGRLKFGAAQAGTLPQHAAISAPCDAELTAKVCGPASRWLLNRLSLSVSRILAPAVA